jgi:pantetheine-phosphate adenylyltransferase
MNKVKVVYPGTFDPITNGHSDVIKRVCKIFPHLVIAVAEDTPKSPLFSIHKRVDQVLKEVRLLDRNSCEVEVMPFSGLLVDFALSQDASLIIRGLRAASDFEYEFQMSYMNFKLSPNLETFFIPANENGHFISSRFVKELARLGGNVDNFVSKHIAEDLNEYFN